MTGQFLPAHGMGPGADCAHGWIIRWTMSGSNVFLNNLISLAVLLLLSGLVGGLMYWGIFGKVGLPKWWSFVPILNFIGLAYVAGRPTWWVIPLIAASGLPVLGWGISFVFWVMLCLPVARVFDRGAGFAVGLILLPIVFYPILSFGSSRYHGSGTALGRPAGA